MAIIQRGALQATIASYSGTGADVALDLGFIPAFAQAVDVTSGAGHWWWNAGLSSTTAASSRVVFGIAASVNATIIGLASIATIGRGEGGILPLDGTAGTGIGLTIGTNTVINISGHAYVVTAWQLH